jgi:enterochelin esterase-like enzyme
VDPRIAGISLVSGWLPAIVDALAIAVLLVVLVRRPRRRSLLMTLLAGAVGVAVGLFLCWVLSDQLNLFDVSLSPISRAWVAAAFGGVGLAIGAALRPGRARRVMAIVAVPLALLAGALGVNADFGQYTTVGSLAGSAVAAPIPTSVLAAQRLGAPGATRTTSADAAATALWRDAAPAGSPSHGLVGTVTIPSTVSHFAARAAYLYLPPAALVAHPVALPVLVLLAGQPGGPSNMIASGKIATIVGAFAAAHHGIAPIVVVPDQLTAPQVNPMCVDSALGDSATYLTVDVPNWIRAHLTVQTSAASWAIGGFSEGGTCSIQLGAAHPDLFGGIFDISGQVAPKNGTLPQTIARGFGGSTAAYTAALPLSILAAGAPYANTVAVFISGQFDTKYGPESDTVFAAATSAGMHATRAVSPGTAHDWHTVQWALRTQLGPIYQQLGVERPGS